MTIASGSMAKALDVWKMHSFAEVGGCAENTLGALNVTGGQTLNVDKDKLLDVTSICIESGGTLSTSGSTVGTVYIRCYGDCIISGSIDFSDNITNGYTVQNTRGTDGGNGGAGTAGSAGIGGTAGPSYLLKNKNLRMIYLPCGTDGGTGGTGNGSATGGGGGGGGGGSSAQNGGTNASAAGTGGGGSAGSGGAGGAGGKGGVSLYIETGGNFTGVAGSLIDCSGEDGTNGSAGTNDAQGGGGGGGGGGGNIWIRVAGSITNNGTMICSGGTGGTGSGTGGDGGNGGAGTATVEAA